MLILGQNGDLIVNMDNINSIQNYKMTMFKDEKNQEKWRILAMFGGNDCLGIGDYDTEKRTEEIIKEICCGFASKLKVYKMPEK